jgi:hypothetical protein
MDASRFDSVTRSVSSGLSRRDVLRGPASAVFDGSLGGAADACLDRPMNW